MTTLTQVIKAHQPYEPSPAIRQTAALREEINAQVQAFLAAGGKIQQVETGATAYDLTVRRDKQGKLVYLQNRFSHVRIGSSKKGNRK
ncbi:hypothetical protein Q2E61_09325 [Microbulbifer thermotolerans]|uniref:hypothetical protein n=1 Tax=Microbulbifer thermotolerans TaxID=252514 RepID=UPI002670D4A9|nr:hypothetical protein [Microbulbifer thermotolerans]WKT59128.1 hypothetical protein Q2E61_09325 [Microbulbifer thermotolerans]